MCVSDRVKAFHSTLFFFPQLEKQTRKDHDIDGIVINQKEHKISQYVDYTSLALDDFATFLESVLDTLEIYANLSSLKINTGKTKLIWIGSKKLSADVFHHSRWKLDGGYTFFSIRNIFFL
jgi:hypothetical protein